MHPSYTTPLLFSTLIVRVRYSLPAPAGHRPRTRTSRHPRLVSAVEDKVLGADRACAASDAEGEVDVAEVAVGLLEQRPAARVLLPELELDSGVRAGTSRMRE